jgi:pimeloyl-ACP methyl ester carboxylesterase
MRPTRASVLVLSCLMGAAFAQAPAPESPAPRAAPQASRPGAAAEAPPRIDGLRSLMGTLADGTAYRVDVPANWSGAALFNLDYASPNAPYSEQSRLLLARGYALAGVTRAVSGWRVPLAVDNLTTVKGLFEAEFGAIRQPIAFGGSMGGHTVMIGAHRKPSPWVAGVSNCAGPAGAVAQWNEKMDTLFVAKTLLAPDSDLPIIDVPADFEKTALPAWKAMLEKAQQTPEGRARIALAAVLGGLPDWASMDKPRPAATDFDARQAGYYEAFAGGRLAAVAQMMSSRRQINTLYGGNISWNTGVDYKAALSKLPEKKLVESLYKRAKLNLAADLKALAKAPRISEQAVALRNISEQQYFGDLSVPVISMQGIGDPISASDAMSALNKGARAAGKQDLLRMVYTETAGHCTFSPGEIAAVVDVVKQRLDSGRWPDTAPASMNSLARTAAPAAPARFIEYQANPFLRELTPKEFARRSEAPAR